MLPLPPPSPYPGHQPVLHPGSVLGIARELLLEGAVLPGSADEGHPHSEGGEGEGPRLIPG